MTNLCALTAKQIRDVYPLDWRHAYAILAKVRYVLPEDTNETRANFHRFDSDSDRDKCL